MKPELPPAAAAAKKTKVAKRPPADTAGTGEGHAEAVRQMAYRLYLERGCADGHEVEDWLRAEALVSQQAARSAPVAKKAAPAAAKRVPAPAATKKPAAPAAKRSSAKPRGE